MESDDLMSDQVIALLQTRGDGVGIPCVAGEHHWGLDYSIVSDRFWKGRLKGQILTSAQVFVVPVRPPSLILNQTALGEHIYQLVRLFRWLDIGKTYEPPGFQL